MYKRQAVSTTLRSRKKSCCASSYIAIAIYHHYYQVVDIIAAVLSCFHLQRDIFPEHHVPSHGEVVEVSDGWHTVRYPPQKILHGGELPPELDQGGAAVWSLRRHDEAAVPHAVKVGLHQEQIRRRLNRQESCSIYHDRQHLSAGVGARSNRGRNTKGDGACPWKAVLASASSSCGCFY